MRDETVARSYAETLFELAQRNQGLDAFSVGIEAIARTLEETPQFRMLLETPRVPASEKKALVKKVFGASLPRPLLNFVLVTIDKRRQRLLTAIAREFRALVDRHEGRQHVDVTVSRPIDAAESEALTARLSQLLGTQAIAHVRVRPDILGGIIVRTGGTIYDGSVRRRLDRMRRQLLQARLPGGSPASTTPISRT